MSKQKVLGIYSKLIYFILLDLNQPFTFDECLAAVRSDYPGCTKKMLRIRLKILIDAKCLERRRIKLKNYYKCLRPKEDPILSTEAPPPAPRIPCPYLDDL